MILYLRYENGFGRLGGLMETAKCADEADLKLVEYCELYELWWSP